MTKARTVVVAGGARGIGRAITEHLAEEGWTVIATFTTGRDEGLELSRTHDVDVRHLNMTDRSAPLCFARGIRAEFSVNALVNNAGTSRRKERAIARRVRGIEPSKSMSLHP